MTVARPRARGVRRVVFFDLDDTLFDHSAARRAGLRAMARELPRPPGRTLEEIDAEYQRLIEEFHPQVLAGRWSRTEARHRRFTALLGWLPAPASRNLVRTLAKAYAEAYRHARAPTPGAKALLRQLSRNYGIGIITNNLGVEQRDKLRAIGLQASVDHLVISEEVGFAKPSPEIFETALRLAQVQPGDALMIGDSLELDVRAAQRCGLRAIWYRRGTTRPRPTPTVPYLASFRPLVRATRRIDRAFREPLGPVSRRRAPVPA